MENIILQDFTEEILDDYEYIIHLSDIHIRLKSREEEYRSVFNSLYEKLRKYNSKNGLIVITGDIFHDKLSLTPEAIILCTEFFKNLSSILKTIIIISEKQFIRC
jgi:DNA repair exonuclease SbcCD nuclease subunit